MKLTLDWNCVIEVEEGRSHAAAVVDLIQGHRNGDFEVALLAASASENTTSKRFPGNAKLFKARIANLGWDDLPIVRMPAISGLSYINFCYFIGDREAFVREKAALWAAIAPNVNIEPRTHLLAGQNFDDDAIQSEALAKWRNTWCDVISAYSHIQEGRDLFVTNNTKDFQNNGAALASLGMLHISTPSKAREMIANL